MGQIDHPNIIKLYGKVESKDKIMLAYELCSSTTFKQYLEEQGALSEEPDALKFFNQIAGALNALFELGVVHRDVKPDNLFMTMDESEGIKLGDLGCARESETNMTGRVGTPYYRAPEIHFHPDKKT